jgi:DNA-3-methyladenine glycosylase II
VAAPSETEAAAVARLRAADPVLRHIIDRVAGDSPLYWRPSTPDDHYGALVRTIVGQQLSTRAAAAIHERLISQFGNRNPTPEEVLAADPEQMRVAAGLSHAKVDYLRSLAEHVLDGSLDLDGLDRLSDDEVIAALVAVKGLGTWSAHIFLMFQLQRPDVLAVGDLGIRRAMMVAYALPTLPGPKEMEAIAEPWRPYRTLACLALWRSAETTPLGAAEPA